MTSATSTLESTAFASGLSRRARPPRASALTASLVFAWRSVLKIKHVPEQLSDVVMIPIIFTLMFTYLFGGALAGSTGAYLQFLLPGTLVMTVLLLTMYTAVGLSTDISNGVSDRFRSLPIWQPAAILGALIGDVGRYLFASSIVLALGFILGFHAAAGVLGVAAALGLILLFSFCLSWLWTVLGMLSRSPASIYNLGMMILFPLTLASNVFVEPETTPRWLRTFIDVNPVSHLVTAVRSLMVGNAAWDQIAWVLIASATLVVVFAPLTVRLYGREH